MSATLNENMSNHEEQDPPETLESYASLVKQLREDLAARNEELREVKEKLKENSGFSKMGYQERLVGNAFAEVYTGLDTDTSHSTREDLEMADLLRCAYGMPVTTSIPTDPLGQMIWLEKNILEETRVFRKRNSWVLLTFRFLIKVVVSNEWPACCVAVVRLALLRNKYPMYNQHDWDSFVAGLIDQYHQLDIDPLAQACFAYLCLTTSNPPLMMAKNLPGTLSQAIFDAGVRIPELVLLLESESRDVASAHIGGSLTVVIVRREHQEAVFSKFATGWSFSVEPIDASAPHASIRSLTWGSRPEQSVNVESQSRMWRHINSHHQVLVTRARQEIRDRIHSKLAGLRARLGRP